MKRLALGTAAVILVATPAMAEDWDFILTNDSGKEIKTLELSAEGAGAWQPNKLDPELKKEETLKPGSRMTVFFDKGAGCKYDLKATFADGTTAVWNALDVCGNAFFTIRYNASGAPTVNAS